MRSPLATVLEVAKKPPWSYSFIHVTRASLPEDDMLVFEDSHREFDTIICRFLVAFTCKGTNTALICGRYHLATPRLVADQRHKVHSESWVHVTKVHERQKFMKTSGLVIHSFSCIFRAFPMLN